jgi:hypothetical protein
MLSMRDHDDIARAFAKKLEEAEGAVRTSLWHVLTYLQLKAILMIGCEWELGCDRFASPPEAALA